MNSFERNFPFWFLPIFKAVEKTYVADLMKSTVEDSPWHRESSTWVHTLMVLDSYFSTYGDIRSRSEQMLTCVALLAHDFGKPEAEDVLDKKDGSGQYRSYAGHEKISANVFMNFICDNVNGVRDLMFDKLNFTWRDIRTVKFMIEHHLPYGLKDKTKRENLRTALQWTLMGSMRCFYDMLRSDARGRISDDHETKLQNVEDWIDEFDSVQPKNLVYLPDKPTITLLVGPSGAGKSTYTKEHYKDALIVSEDEYRLAYAELHMDSADRAARLKMSTAEWYNAAWQFCTFTDNKGYTEYVQTEWAKALQSGRDIVLDNTNQSRKYRARWINNALARRSHNVHTVEFFVSESLVKSRQAGRGDKKVPEQSIHQQVMNMEVPWMGVETHKTRLVTL